MPSRGSYAVASREEGKAAQRDQSYRSCIIALLIFFLLCIVLILASWPWKKMHNNENNSVETSRIGGNEFPTSAEEDLENKVEAQTKRSRVDTKNEPKKSSKLPMNTKNVGKSSQLPVNSEEKFERYVNHFSTISTELPVNSEERSDRYVNTSTISTELPVNSEEKSERYVNTSTISTELPENPEKKSEGYVKTSTSTELPVNPEEKAEGYAKTSTISTALPVNPEKTSEGYVKNVSTELPQISIHPEEYFRGLLDNSSTLESDINSTEISYEESQTTSEKIESTVQTSSPQTSEELIISSDLTSAATETENVYFKHEESVVNSTPATETTEHSSEPADYSSSSLSMDQYSENKFETTRATFKDFTSLKKLLEARYLGKELTTLSSKDVEENWLDESKDSDPQELLKSSKSKEFSSSTKDKLIYTSEHNLERTTTEKTTTAKSFEEITSHTEKINELKICRTGKCKQRSSKIVSYMNHSADPCEDFYEYACGGMEADYQIADKDLSRGVFEIIERQAKKYQNYSEHSKFNNYYDSCFKYEANFQIELRIELAREALDKIGKFYTTANWPEGFQGFTQIFANMLLFDRPLIFDILPDVNETNSEAFALKIGPVVDNKLFQFANGVDFCKDESEETLQNSVNLDQLYFDYKNCKNDTRSFVASIKQALSELGIFDSIKNNYNISQYVDRTVVNIDIDIIKKILWKFPQESEIHEAYRSKRYTLMSLGELQENCKLLNWTQLINSLTGLTLGANDMLQVYFKDELIAAIRHLEDLNYRQPLELNNALLGLYARNLYQDLVATRFSRDLHRHCLYISAHYMRNEASKLYMSSFTDDEIRRMKSMLGVIFRELKTTLRDGILSAEWTEGRSREVLLKKLSDIKISLPDNWSSEKKNELNITDNYFINSMNLMKKYRSMIYSVISKNPRHLEQIWTFFAAPFDWKAQTIYGLSLIVFPFGALDWSALSESGDPFNPITRASVFNLNAIAREIAHNFDTNGIRYWSGSHDSESAFLSDGDAKSAYDEYINCHQESLYQEELSMSLPLTGQQVYFTIPRLSVNERLSDLVGMRLVNDTLARLGHVAIDNERLPWLDLNVNQLFYLTYAQNLCTKSPLTSSYVSLHEDSTLPSRIRVFAVASNSRNLGDAWKCPEGSKITPAFMCDTFPHLESRDNGLDAV